MFDCEKLYGLLGDGRVSAADVASQMGISVLRLFMEILNLPDADAVLDRLM